jgi:uncharacterized membrane protein YhiD involved in acid resistance
MKKTIFTIATLGIVAVSFFALAPQNLKTESVFFEQKTENQIQTQKLEKIAQELKIDTQKLQEQANKDTCELFPRIKTQEECTELSYIARLETEIDAVAGL